MLLLKAKSSFCPSIEPAMDVKLTNWLHGAEPLRSHKLLLKKFPTYYGTRGFNTMFTRALH
jgi:hypothetical protein